MGKADHAFYEKYSKLHDEVPRVNGGACLSDHESVYRENNSCSYRWQGIVKAAEALGSSVYNAKGIKATWYVGKNSFRYKEAKTIEKGLAGKIVRLTGRISKDGKIQAEILNFTNGSVPYANQVHHVLPTGLLRVSITDLAQYAPTIKDLICEGLLDEKYNQNFKDNMLILPQENDESVILGLPKHCGSHPTYDSSIKGRIQSSMRPYKKIALQLRKKTKDHDKPNPKQLKEDLLKISNIMYEAVVNFGQSTIKNRGGFGVNDLPNAVFNNIKTMTL